MACHVYGKEPGVISASGSTSSPGANPLPEIPAARVDTYVNPMFTSAVRQPSVVATVGIAPATAAMYNTFGTPLSVHPAGIPCGNPDVPAGKNESSADTYNTFGSPLSPPAEYPTTTGAPATTAVHTQPRHVEPCAAPMYNTFGTPPPNGTASATATGVACTPNTEMQPVYEGAVALNLMYNASAAHYTVFPNAAGTPAGVIHTTTDNVYC